ncbi:MAG TPA: phospholipase D-like domain-containing protein [Candidatus Bathyarchaeia archaeon]|jgi:phosphatidylserine/phosphatidylglycerophosphate/cardiolipin synthase-like enzyme|nr:phospholipase D-like domain-containing protein [Candidatus Bathyarchaeia archaeon]
MTIEVAFTRAASVAACIERLLESARVSIDAALYRFANPRLARALVSAASRGVSVHLVLDRGKYRETPATRELLSTLRIPYRLSCGRQGAHSKMHHKFSIVDSHTVLSGSYNWTLDSEELNYEDLVILREPEIVESYRREFEELWRSSAEAP